jgi:hypothetical protein
LVVAVDYIGEVERVGFDDGHEVIHQLFQAARLSVEQRRHSDVARCHDSRGRKGSAHMDAGRKSTRVEVVKIVEAPISMTIRPMGWREAFFEKICKQARISTRVREIT